MNHRVICDYLLPENAESFWLWSSEFEAVTWWSGESIAFYQEFDAVVRRLQAHGLPAFSELVLVLAACRKNWNEPGGGKALFASYLQTLDENPLPGGSKNVIADWVRPLLNGLDRVHAHFLENPTLERKLTILEFLFEEHGHALSSKEAGEVALVLGRGDVAVELWDKHPEYDFPEADLFAQRFSSEGVLRGKIDHAVRGEPLCRILSEGDLTTIDAEVSGNIEAYFEENAFSPGDIIATIRVSRSPTPGFVRMIQNLLVSLRPLESIESLATREETGLDALPKPADELADELPEFVAVRNLIRELASDENEELAGIAKVARDLLGVLNVPRDVSDPDDMPLGGFSDIANKGDLDRLLLSELAQDDEVLAVRVALNEALYLRRESPPQDPPRQRRIFIDTGIRMWGVPRAFAHSAALALAATMGPRDEAKVFSANADMAEPGNAKLLPANLKTRSGLEDSLTRLSPAPHPGRQVVEFLERTGDAAVDCESIVITHPRALTDPGFRRELRAAGSNDDGALLILTVDERGELILICRTTGGERELRRLQLEPDRVNRSPGSKRQRGHSPVDDTLPKILRLDPFPLLIAHPFHQKNTWVSPEGEVVTVNRNGLMLHYREPNFGGIQISDSFQVKGACLASTFEGNGSELILVFGKSPTPRVFHIQLDHRKIRDFKVTLPKTVDHAIYAEGHVVFFAGREVAAFSIQQGSIVRQTLLDQEAVAARDRFVYFGGVWHAVSVREELEFTPLQIGGENICVPFDCPLYAEPLVILADTSVRRFDGSKNPVIPFTEEKGQGFSGLHGVTDGGMRVVFNSHDLEARWIVVDFRDESRIRSQFLPGPVGDGGWRLESKMTIRKRFDFVMLAQSSLVLENHGNQVEIAVRGGDHFQLVPREKEEGERFEFRPYSFSGYKLQCAELPDGSRVFLDSRGMLHLQSADRTIPEITFILKDLGMLSGWTSEGDYFGQSYFAGDHETTPTLKIAAELAKFVRQANPE